MKLHITEIERPTLCQETTYKHRADKEGEWMIGVLGWRLNVLPDGTTEQTCNAFWYSTHDKLFYQAQACYDPEIWAYLPSLNDAAGADAIYTIDEVLRRHYEREYRIKNGGKP